VAEVFELSSERDLVGALARLSPGTADTLHRAVSAADAKQTRRTLTLEAALATLRQEAPYLRYMSTANFDSVMQAFGSGMQQLQAAGSDWCRGPAIAELTRLNATDLVPYVLSEIAASDAAYTWILDWTRTLLAGAIQARNAPVRHGDRTLRDEQVVQAYGRQLGMERWNVALSIASFSQAEGRDYATMREAIAGMNICQLGVTLADLSERLPADVRGRVLAELAPELFYGNTPYVLYLLQGYFFIG
jgi:hypothetical protein